MNLKNMFTVKILDSASMEVTLNEVDIWWKGRKTWYKSMYFQSGVLSMFWNIRFNIIPIFSSETIKGNILTAIRLALFNTLSLVSQSYISAWDAKADQKASSISRTIKFSFITTNVSLTVKSSRNHEHFNMCTSEYTLVSWKHVQP